ncbi:MAG TPA: phosphatase PAP2 family protein, partial [Firmicutes bacterium]|nr:phosphatase PAP2 family protein [Bacillota bacterium]
MDLARTIRRPVFLIVFFLLAAAVLINIFSLDIIIQQFFYTQKGWEYGSGRWAYLLYNYGTYPGLALSGLALVVLASGFVLKKAASYRKEALIVILTVMLGPGLIINVISKEYTGRPRPREITEFGGQWKFKKVFEFGKPGMGHSFPAGHPSAGFLFYALYAALRRRHGKTAAGFFWFSILYGSAIGAARMAQGGHFFSDVIWS